MIIYDILLQATSPVQQLKPGLCDREEESCIRGATRYTLHVHPYTWEKLEIHVHVSVSSMKTHINNSQTVDLILIKSCIRFF